MSSAAPASTCPVRRPGHVVLLGDSIFDNGSYVRGGPDVVAQLRTHLPEGWKATLAAVDGAVTDGVAHQLKRVPADATMLVVSVGGNDALGASHVLSAPAKSVGDAVGQLVSIRDKFAGRYGRMLDQVCKVGLPTAVCTIYDANHPSPQHELIVAGLSLFNDTITRAAFSRHLPVIDLRLLCNESADYANPIEPSTHGGDKIARAISRLAVAVHTADLEAAQKETGLTNASLVIAHPTDQRTHEGKHGCQIQ